MSSQTLEWLEGQVRESLRKIQSGSTDLDVASAEHERFRTLVRIADVSLQARRLLKGQKIKGGKFPITFSPDAEEGEGA